MRNAHTYQFPFAQFPAVRILLFFAAGISVSQFFSPDIPILIGTGCTLTIFWVISDFFIRKKFHLSAGRIATISYLMLIFLSGSMLFSFGEIRNDRKIQQTEPLHLYAWEDIRIKGHITSTGRSSNGNPVIVITVRETEFPEQVIWRESYKIRTYGNLRHAELTSGSVIEAEIRLYEFPERRNPHEFNYGRWLHQNGIMAHGELKTVETEMNGRFFSWGNVRAAVQQNVDEVFDEQHAPLVKALVLGYKEELTPETKLHFSRSGLAHIMAVSGLHVGFLVAPFWLIIPYLWGSEKGKWFGLLFLTLLLIGYAGLTGFSASVSRASLMAWFLTCGRIFHRMHHSVNLTAIAAIILLLIKPAQLFDVGFQLSFSAVFIILLVMPQARRLIPAKIRYKKSGAFLTLILVSVLVQGGLFPLLIYYFGEFSIVGPLANAVVVPLLSVTVPAALGLSLAGPLDFWLAGSLPIPVQYSIGWIHSTAEFFGSMDASYLTMEHHSVSLFLIWIAGVLFLASLQIPSVRWKWLAVLLLMMNLFWAEAYLKKETHQHLEVTFLDVGQGDAAHIKTPTGKHILIDAGRWSPGSNSGDRILVPYFEHYGIEKIDALILSHPHADHIGGVEALIENLTIEKIYQSPYEYDSALYKRYMQKAREKNISIKEPMAGSILDIDPAIRIFVLGPEESGAHFSNPNNHSLVAKLVYGKTSVLFSGDAESEQENQIAGRYGDFLDSDLYKVGHHASNTSSNAAFIGYANPEVSVASLAFHNRFRHPGQETVNRLNQYSSDLKFTSLTGAVKYRSDGENFKLLDW